MCLFDGMLALGAQYAASNMIKLGDELGPNKKYSALQFAFS